MRGRDFDAAIHRRVKIGQRGLHVDGPRVEHAVAQHCRTPTFDDAVACVELENLDGVAPVRAFELRVRADLCALLQTVVLRDSAGEDPCGVGDGCRHRDPEIPELCRSNDPMLSAPITSANQRSLAEERYGVVSYSQLTILLTGAVLDPTRGQPPRIFARKRRIFCEFP